LTNASLSPENWRRKRKRPAGPGIAETWAVKTLEFEAEANVIRDSIRRTDEIAARFADA